MTSEDKITFRVATWLACCRMGNKPRTKNSREIAGEMTGSHFSGGGGPKWTKNWPDMQKSTKF